jgi:hypothetical protein
MLKALLAIAASLLVTGSLFTFAIRSSRDSTGPMGTGCRQCVSPGWGTTPPQGFPPISPAVPNDLRDR